MTDRVQRPTRHHFVASSQPHYFYYAREADAYMDQCEADIEELVEALERADEYLRFLYEGFPPSTAGRRAQPVRDAISAALAKHKERSHE